MLQPDYSFRGGKDESLRKEHSFVKIQICPSWKLLHEDLQSPDSHKQCLHTLTLLLVTLGRRAPLIAEGHMDQRVPTVQFGNHGCNVPLFVSCYMSLWFTGESQIRNRLQLRETYCEWCSRVFGHPQITLPVSSHSDLDFFSPDYCYVHHLVGDAVRICASNKVSEHKIDTTENISLNCRDRHLIKMQMTVGLSLLHVFITTCPDYHMVLYVGVSQASLQWLTVCLRINFKTLLAPL